MTEQLARKLVEDMGGTVEDVSGPLPDGSGFLTASFPLPKDHWLTKNPEDFNVPPMPFRMGIEEYALVAISPAVEFDLLKIKSQEMNRIAFENKIREAGRYAVRAATENGKIIDFDPDALVRNLIIGMLGYNTINGLSSDEFANPK